MLANAWSGRYLTFAFRRRATITHCHFVPNTLSQSSHELGLNSVSVDIPVSLQASSLKLWARGSFREPEMSRSRRILWSEGMFLTPHHFQQWDNYQEQDLDFRQKALISFPWGLTELEIRREGIANGQITLARCSG